MGERCAGGQLLQPGGSTIHRLTHLESGVCNRRVTVDIGECSTLQFPWCCCTKGSVGWGFWPGIASVHWVLWPRCRRTRVKHRTWEVSLTHGYEVEPYSITLLRGLKVQCCMRYSTHYSRFGRWDTLPYTIYNLLEKSYRINYPYSSFDLNILILVPDVSYMSCSSPLSHVKRSSSTSVSLQLFHTLRDNFIFREILKNITLYLRPH